MGQVLHGCATTTEAIFVNAGVKLGHWGGAKAGQFAVCVERSNAAKAEDFETGAWAQDLSLPPARPEDREAELGEGSGPRLPLPRRSHGLGKPGGSFLRLSNTMDASFCVEALEEALARFGKPEIFNTDQGSQFTSTAFTDVLNQHGIKVSMDGRGRWIDNVFVERLWRSLKHEDVYLKGYADGREARAGISSWVTFYNTRRPHQALGRRTPMAVWRQGITGALGAKAVAMMDNTGALTTCLQQQAQSLAA
jgi:hypothetical protein